MTYSLLGKDENGNTIQVNQGSRRDGMYIIGATGTGKSTLIQSLVLQDIEQGLGVTLLDPHGDLTNRILESMKKRVEDVILLDIANDKFPFGLNLFSCPYPNDIRWVQYTVNQVMHIFDRLYNITRETPNMSYFLRNCTYTIIANPGYTMAEIPILLTNELFRRKLLATVTEERVLRFWSEYERIAKSRYDYNNTVLPILNKLDEFLQPMLLHIVGQSQSTIDLRKIMDGEKLLFLKLDPRLEDMTTLIGSVIVAQVLNAAYSRAELLQNKRPQMNLYCDEFEWFAGEDFMQLVSEARKFGIGTTVSNQTLSQIEEPIKENILQAATLVVFRVSGQDGEELATEFSAKPPPAETRREAVLVPKVNVIDHLLNNGHPNKYVMQFVTEYLQFLKENLTATSPYSIMSYFNDTRREDYPYDPESLRITMQRLNNLFYIWMFPEKGQRANDEREGVEKDLSEILGYSHYYASDVKPQSAEARRLWDDWTETNIEWNKYPYQSDQWYVWKQSADAIEEGIDEICIQSILNDSVWSNGIRIIFGYETEPSRLRALATDTRKREQKRYSAFSKALMYALLALDQEPILTESGRYEDKPLAPRQIADVQKEVAKFLSSPINLPTTKDFMTAYVKTPTGEHKVSIPRSTAGMSRAAFNQRIQTIFDNNHDAGYVRAVELVKQEIKERQTLPAPQPVQKAVMDEAAQSVASNRDIEYVAPVPPPPPQAPPLPASRRRKTQIT